MVDNVSTIDLLLYVITAVLGHSPPQPLDLRGPGLALNENMMPRLPLTTSAPKALPAERARHPVMKKGADRCVSGEELVISASHRLPDPS